MKALLTIILLSFALINCGGIQVETDLDLKGKTFTLVDGDKLVSGQISFCSSSSSALSASPNTTATSANYYDYYNQSNSNWGYGYGYNYDYDTGEYNYGYGYGYNNYMIKNATYSYNYEADVEISFTSGNRFEITMNGDVLMSGTWAYIGGNSIEIKTGSVHIEIDIQVNGASLTLQTNTSDCSFSSSSVSVPAQTIAVDQDAGTESLPVTPSQESETFSAGIEPVDTMEAELVEENNSEPVNTLPIN